MYADCRTSPCISTTWPAVHLRFVIEFSEIRSNPLPVKQHTHVDISCPGRTFESYRTVTVGFLLQSNKHQLQVLGQHFHRFAFRDCDCDYRSVRPGSPVFWVYKSQFKLQHSTPLRSLQLQKSTGPPSTATLYFFILNPYPTAFPYGNGMVLHFYQQQESSTTKTVHKVINKGLKTYV